MYSATHTSSGGADQASEDRRAPIAGPWTNFLKEVQTDTRRDDTITATITYAKKTNTAIVSEEQGRENLETATDVALVALREPLVESPVLAILEQHEDLTSFPGQPEQQDQRALEHTPSVSRDGNDGLNTESTTVIPSEEEKKAEPVTMEIERDAASTQAAVFASESQGESVQVELIDGYLDPKHVLSLDISNGTNRIPLRCVNEIDDEKFPTTINFISKCFSVDDPETEDLLMFTPGCHCNGICGDICLCKGEMYEGSMFFIHARVDSS